MLSGTGSSSPLGADIAKFDASIGPFNKLVQEVGAGGNRMIADSDDLRTRIANSLQQELQRPRLEELLNRLRAAAAMSPLSAMPIREPDLRQLEADDLHRHKVEAKRAKFGGGLG